MSTVPKVVKTLVAFHHKLIVACNRLTIYDAEECFPKMILERTLWGGIHLAGIDINGISHLKVMELDAWNLHRSPIVDYIGTLIDDLFFVGQHDREPT